MDRDWLTTAEVAEYFEVSQRTVRRWVNAGHFPGARKAGPSEKADWRIPKSDVKVFEDKLPTAS